MALAPVIGSQLTAPRVAFSINGIQIAWCSGINIGLNLQHEPMMAVGSFEPIEFVPLSAGSTFSASTFSLVTENFATLGIQASMGQTPQQHLLNLLSIGNQTAVLTDTKTGRIIYTLYNVKFGGTSTGITPNTMTMLDVQFYVGRAVPFGAE